MPHANVSEAEPQNEAMEIPLNKSSSGNSAAEFHNENLRLSNCYLEFPRVMSPMGFSVSFGISESDVTHGIIRKQALEFPRVTSPMGFSVSFGISESDVTHGIFRKQALEFPRVMSPMGLSVSFGSRAPLLLKTKTKERWESYLFGFRGKQ